MNTNLLSVILTIVSSGVGAGVVTFWMNFWKAELDFRRARIEELYAAVHKYTKETHLIAASMRISIPTSKDATTMLSEHYDRIQLLIDLYFPRLRITFKEYALAVEACIVAEGKIRRDSKNYIQDLQKIGNIGDKLKAEVVALSRQGSLRALIEAVEEHDRNSKL